MLTIVYVCILFVTLAMATLPLLSLFVLTISHVSDVCRIAIPDHEFCLARLKQEYMSANLFLCLFPVQERNQVCVLLSVRQFGAVSCGCV